MKNTKKRKEKIQVFVKEAELDKMRLIQQDFSAKGSDLSLSNIARQLIVEGLRGK